MPTLLLVDDDEAVREVLAFNLEEAGHTVVTAADGVEGLSKYTADIDVVLTDLRMPKMDGMALLAAVRERDPTAVVIVLTAYGGTERALEAMRHGAFHYVEKPVNRKALQAVVHTAAQHRHLGRENERLRADSHSIVSASPKMNRVLRLVDKIADSDATVLIRGESGTGKELVARALHAGSSRRRREFITINCAAIPGELLESALFGHEKGSFTGASRAAPGKFRQADRGTIFLDEIAEMPLGLQAKLLRVLQEGEVEVVGAARPQQVDVRVIAATHQDIATLAAEGKFRQDLFYRLNVVPIEIPPLRDRPEDIPVLVRHFIRQLAPGSAISIDRSVDDALVDFDWPGNVRELHNVVERMLLLRDGDTLHADDLPESLSRHQPSTGTLDGLPFILPEEGLDLVELEKLVIMAALEKKGGNQSAAARYLNIPRHVLIYRLEKFGLK
jgi:DNA-binding NtrC family response regulator